MRLFLTILGVLLIAFGLPLFWTPIPVGLIMIAAGVALVIGNSRRSQDWLRERRSRSARLDEKLREAERKSPSRIRKTLEKTQP